MQYSDEKTRQFFSQRIQSKSLVMSHCHFYTFLLFYLTFATLRVSCNFERDQPVSKIVGNLTLNSSCQFQNTFLEILPRRTPIYSNQPYWASRLENHHEAPGVSHSPHSYDPRRIGNYQRQPSYTYVPPTRYPIPFYLHSCSLDFNRINFNSPRLDFDSHNNQQNSPDRLYQSRIDLQVHSNSNDKGWGWIWGKYEKKKKHKTKGALGKILKKFKLKRKPEKLVWKEVPECDGFENFIKDLEILSWLVGLFGLKKGAIGLLLHALNQVYLTVSLFVVGIPDRLGVLLEIIAPGTIPGTVKQTIEIVALIDYAVNVLFSYPLGNLIVLIDFIAELAATASLTLAALTIFSDILEEKVWTIFQLDLRELLEGYGCNNPFSKENTVEKLFKIFTEWSNE